jgi:Methyltransferase domain
MPSKPTVHRDYPCDLCGSDEPIELAYVRLYTGDQPVHVCGRCGFVYVRSRRSSEEIARVWTEELYGGAYTAKKHPAMMPRYHYVADFLASNVPIAGGKVCDIGAGEGFWLKHLADAHAVVPFGIEPSPRNCAEMEQLGLRTFTGTIEQFGAAPEAKTYRADIATILWTLENCLSCMDMLRGAAAILPEGGHIVVATGSRILVPFKKPLFTYLSRAPADVHCFRFSANSLQTALGKAGFRTIATNRYLDNDILCVLGQKSSDAGAVAPKTDHPLEVLSFFERWHQDTLHYLKDWAR